MLEERWGKQLRDSVRVANRASHTSAHELTTTVAPFRAWRGLQPIIARGPTQPTIKLIGLSSNLLNQPAIIQPANSGTRENGLT